MKRVCLMVLLLLVAGGAQVYGAQFGPLTAATGDKGVSFGVGYTFLPDEWDIGTAGAKNVEVKMHQGFLQCKLVGSRFEAFVRGGVSSLEAEGGFRFGDGNLETDQAMAFVTAGAGVLVINRETLKIGPFFQGTYYTTGEAKGSGAGIDNTTGVTYTGVETVYIDNLQEGVVGLKGQLEIEGVALYFGPAYFYNTADYRSIFGGSSSTVPVLTRVDVATGDLEATHKVGGFFGMFWKLDENYRLELEAQIKQDVAFGGAISYRF